MSLDLYLSTKKKREHVGTGVFIREDGKTKELQTVEEVRAHFPDMDTSEIEERVYETNYLFDKNITHNLCKMADHVPCNEGKNTLYHLLWRPDEHGFNVVTEQYRLYVAECLCYMLTHREKLLQYNPKNGWGSFESLYNYTLKLAEALQWWDGKEEVEIYASR